MYRRMDQTQGRPRYHHSQLPPPPPPPHDWSPRDCLDHGINRTPPDKEMVFNIYTPHANDVLCGRGGGANRHIGNTNFREVVGSNKATYVKLTKRQKMAMARSIFDAVRSQDPPGRFLQRDQSTETWFDIGRPRALEKISQALREKTTDKGSSLLSLLVKTKHDDDHINNDLSDSVVFGNELTPSQSHAVDDDHSSTASVHDLTSAASSLQQLSSTDEGNENDVSTIHIDGEISIPDHLVSQFRPKKSHPQTVEKHCIPSTIPAGTYSRNPIFDPEEKPQQMTVRAVSDDSMHAMPPPPRRRPMSPMVPSYYRHPADQRMPPPRQLESRSRSLGSVGSSSFEQHFHHHHHQARHFEMQRNMQHISLPLPPLPPPESSFVLPSHHHYGSPSAPSLALWKSNNSHRPGYQIQNYDTRKTIVNPSNLRGHHQQYRSSYHSPSPPRLYPTVANPQPPGSVNYSTRLGMYRKTAISPELPSPYLMRREENEHYCSPHQYHREHLNNDQKRIRASEVARASPLLPREEPEMSRILHIDVQPRLGTKEMSVPYSEIDIHRDGTPDQVKEEAITQASNHIHRLVGLAALSQAAALLLDDDHYNDNANMTD